MTRTCHMRHGNGGVALTVTRTCHMRHGNGGVALTVTRTCHMRHGNGGVAHCARTCDMCHGNSGVASHCNTNMSYLSWQWWDCVSLWHEHVIFIMAMVGLRLIVTQTHHMCHGNDRVRRVINTAVHFKSCLYENEVNTCMVEQICFNLSNISQSK